jgi:hypothetical protein
MDTVDGASEEPVTVAEGPRTVTPDKVASDTNRALRPRRWVRSTGLLLAAGLIVLVGSWAADKSLVGLFDQGTSKNPNDAPSGHHSADDEPDTLPTELPRDPAADIGDEEINTPQIMKLPDCGITRIGTVGMERPKFKPDPPVLGGKAAVELSIFRLPPASHAVSTWGARRCIWTCPRRPNR